MVIRDGKLLLEKNTFEDLDRFTRRPGLVSYVGYGERPERLHRGVSPALGPPRRRQPAPGPRAPGGGRAARDRGIPGGDPPRARTQLRRPRPAPDATRGHRPGPRRSNRRPAVAPPACCRGTAEAQISTAPDRAQGQPERRRWLTIPPRTWARP